MTRQLRRTAADDAVECVVEVMLIACLQRSYANGCIAVRNDAASDHPVAMADMGMQGPQHPVQPGNAEPGQVQCLVMDPRWQGADDLGAREVHDMHPMARARLRGGEIENLMFPCVQSPGSKNVCNGEWEFRCSQHQAARQRPSGMGINGKMKSVASLWKFYGDVMDS